MALILTVVFVFLILLGSELYWRQREAHNEFSRKFVHITVGSFVAIWPWLLTWHQIQLLSIAFIVVVGISKYLHVFKSIHSVQRPTYGELCFALAVGVVPLITHDQWIFMSAILIMSLADGFAAVFGERFGKQSYLVFGHKKSLVGTMTFFLISLGILFGYTYVADVQIAVTIIMMMAAGATVIENFAVYGLDNLLAPAFVAFLLTRV